MTEHFDIVQAYNVLIEGTISPETYLELHARIVRDDTACSFPESLGRTAAELIEAGFITPEGEITLAGYEAVAEDWHPHPLTFSATSSVH